VIRISSWIESGWLSTTQRYQCKPFEDLKLFENIHIYVWVIKITVHPVNFWIVPPHATNTHKNRTAPLDIYTTVSQVIWRSESLKGGLPWKLIETEWPQEHEKEELIIAKPALFSLLRLWLRVPEGLKGSFTFVSYEFMSIFFFFFYPRGKRLKFLQAFL